MSKKTYWLWVWFSGVGLGAKDPVRKEFYQRYSNVYRERKIHKARYGQIEIRYRMAFNEYMQASKFPAPVWEATHLSYPAWMHFAAPLTIVARKPEKHINEKIAAHYQQQNDQLRKEEA